MQVINCFKLVSISNRIYYIVLEWSSGKKTKNEDQDADTPEPSSHPLEGFSCSKEELEQEAEQKQSEDSVEPEPLDTSANRAEPEVKCEETPVPKTVIDQDSQASQAPVVEESQVPGAPEKAVVVEDSQEVGQQEYFQEDQTPPEWNEGPGVDHDTMEAEPANMPPEPTLPSELSQPATPSKEQLKALEKGEEQDDLKSDEDELSKRQAFKAGFIMLGI